MKLQINFKKVQGENFFGGFTRKKYFCLAIFTLSATFEYLVVVKARTFTGVGRGGGLLSPLQIWKTTIFRVILFGVQAIPIEEPIEK